LQIIGKSQDFNQVDNQHQKKNITFVKNDLSESNGGSGGGAEEVDKGGKENNNGGGNHSDEENNEEDGQPQEEIVPEPAEPGIFIYFFY
jgi:hypothetical protein